MRIKKLSALIITVIIALLLSVNVSYAKAEEISVYLGGYTAGFVLNTKGATVVGLSEVVTDDGKVSPAKCAGVKEGDVIISMNGTPINHSKDLEEFLNNYKSGFVVTEIERNGETKILDVFPEKDLNGKYRIGVFIRDDLNGLGTVTFTDKSGLFASLGHPVSNDLGKPFDIVSGFTYDSSIVGVNKPIRGKAGELKGMYIGEKPTGGILKNTQTGLYGVFYDFNELLYRKICVGKAQMGKAQICSTVDGATPKLYDIEIVKVDSRSGNNKNLVIHVIDKELLSYTGGILQGMSGSPILQNGKLVGAVTHVFINDATRGYGICIERMLNDFVQIKRR